MQLAKIHIARSPSSVNRFWYFFVQKEALYLYFTIKVTRMRFDDFGHFLIEITVRLDQNCHSGGFLRFGLHMHFFEKKLGICTFLYIQF